MENYKYLNKISSGAFSNVGLFVNKNKYYAIKISNNKSKNEGILCNELREIISLMILKNHNNIIDIFEIFLNTQLDLNLVYKYYPETLTNYFCKTNLYNRIDYSISFCEQMLSILEFLNINSIIHTDIKPSNILIYFKNNHFNIKLIDFGSCHIEGLTSKYSIITTYTHRAPEVYEYNKKYDYKVDIWSFGVILYEFITGLNILNYKIHNKTDDILKLKDLYDFCLSFNNLNLEDNYKLFLSKIFVIDPKKRCDIYELIDLFLKIFNKKIKKYDRSVFSYCINKKDKNLVILNKYITERIFNVNLKNLNFGNFLISKLKEVNDLDYICIWYLNYQFNHSDVEYNLDDFIYIFNSYYQKIYNKVDIHNNCFNLLYLIDFNLL